MSLVERCQVNVEGDPSVKSSGIWVNGHTLKGSEYCPTVTKSIVVQIELILIIYVRYIFLYLLSTFIFIPCCQFLGF